MTPTKLRRQRPVKGGRDPLPACVLHAIRAEVEATAQKFHCSRSFVIATALAEAFGIDVEETYYETRPRLRVVAKRRSR